MPKKNKGTGRLALTRVQANARGQQRPNGLPDSEEVELVYYDRFARAMSSLSVNDQVFRINSAFDPDLTGSGHQPRYYDRYAAVYNRYRVDKVEVEARLRGEQDNSALVLVVVPTTVSTALTGDTSTPELPRAVMSPKVASLYEAAVVRTTFWPHEIAGVTRQRYKDDDIYSAQVTTNPSLSNYFHVVTMTMGGAVSTATVAVDVKLIYHVTFYERFVEGPSIAGPVPAGFAGGAGAAAAASQEQLEEVVVVGRPLPAAPQFVGATRSVARRG